MTKNEYLQLEVLLKKLIDESETALVMQNTKPCLNMVQEQLELINNGYKMITHESSANNLL